MAKYLVTFILVLTVVMYISRPSKKHKRCTQFGKSAIEGICQPDSFYGAGFAPFSNN